MFLVCYVVAVLCSHKFHCAVWARENWWNNFLTCGSSGQRCIDTTKITQGARLCRWLKNFLLIKKLHHNVSTWFSTCEISGSGLPLSEVYSSLGGAW